jgi:hypothetical protein
MYLEKRRDDMDDEKRLMHGMAFLLAGLIRGVFGCERGVDCIL